MAIVPATITAEVMEHADGRPVAYIDATAVAVFVYQEPDGTHVIDIITRDDIPPCKLRLLMDGEPLAVRAGMGMVFRRSSGRDRSHGPECRA